MGDSPDAIHRAAEMFSRGLEDIPFLNGVQVTYTAGAGGIYQVSHSLQRVPVGAICLASTNGSYGVFTSDGVTYIPAKTTFWLSVPVATTVTMWVF